MESPVTQLRVAQSSRTCRIAANHVPYFRPSKELRDLANRKEAAKDS
jgi:nucleoid DNA-binding protein